MRARSAAGERVCILVLGMHRSGTSALTRTLNLLGCDLPKTLVPATASNELGHWEPDPVHRLNDALLDSAGSNWHDFEAVNPDWFQSPKAGEFRQRAIKVLDDEFGGSWLYVLKDPRICRIAGWWVDAIETSGVRPAIVSILRNPLEVAASLKTRDGFDLSRGMLLWLRNTLEAEAQTRGRARAFLSYNSLLDDWRKALGRVASELNLAWPKKLGAVTSSIDQFLSDDHRHHRRADDAPSTGAHAWVNETHVILSRWAEQGERADDYAALDRIRTSFDEAGLAFARIVELQAQNQEQAAQLEKTVSEKERVAAEAEKKLAEAEKRLQQFAEQTADLKARLSQSESALRQRSLEAEESLNEIEALKAQLAEATQTLNSQLADAEAVRAKEAEFARKEFARLAAQAAEAKSASAAELAARFGEISTMSRLLKAREIDEAALRQALKDQEAAAAEAKVVEAGRIEATLKALASLPFLPALRGRQMRQRAAMLAATGLFDPQWYRSRYSDIAETGVDPALHFLKFGLREGRHPSLDVARARGER